MRTQKKVSLSIFYSKDDAPKRLHGDICEVKTVNATGLRRLIGVFNKDKSMLSMTIVRHKLGAILVAVALLLQSCEPVRFSSGDRWRYTATLISIYQAGNDVKFVYHNQFGYNDTINYNRRDAPRDAAVGSHYLLYVDTINQRAKAVLIK